MHKNSNQVKKLKMEKQPIKNQKLKNLYHKFEYLQQ